MELYQQCLRRFGRRHRFMAFIDSDEVRCAVATPFPPRLTSCLTTAPALKLRLVPSHNADSTLTRTLTLTLTLDQTPTLTLTQTLDLSLIPGTCSALLCTQTITLPLSPTLTPSLDVTLTVTLSRTLPLAACSKRISLCCVQFFSLPSEKRARGAPRTLPELLNAYAFVRPFGGLVVRWLVFGASGHRARCGHRDNNEGDLGPGTNSGVQVIYVND